jgi:hypothetical protein
MDKQPKQQKPGSTDGELKEASLDKVTGGADLLIKIDAVEGESMNKDHKDQIEIHSF